MEKKWNGKQDKSPKNKNKTTISYNPTDLHQKQFKHTKTQLVTTLRIYIRNFKHTHTKSWHPLR